MPLPLRDARAQIGETLAAGRPLMGGAEPERKARAIAAGEEIGAHLPLPLPQMLLGEFGNRDRLRGVIHGGENRRGRLPRAGKIAREPHRVARQLVRQRREHFRRGDVAIDVRLAVDVHRIRHRRMPDPPPARLVRFLVVQVQALG